MRLAGTFLTFGWLILTSLTVSAQSIPQGRTAKEVCYAFVRAQQQMMIRSPRCDWKNYSQYMLPAQWTPDTSYYDRTRLLCSGTIECETPYPEANRIYWIETGRCSSSPALPDARKCGRLNPNCIDRVIDAELNDCSRLTD